MRLLLDTVTFLWAVGAPERLSPKAARALQDGKAIRELSSISICEIAIKSASGKLSFGIDDVKQGIDDLRVRILPFTAEHAFTLFGLPGHHADPFDRQLIAQSLCENISIVTIDPKFSLYKGVKIVW